MACYAVPALMEELCPKGIRGSRSLSPDECFLGGSNDEETLNNSTGRLHRTESGGSDPCTNIIHTEMQAASTGNEANDPLASDGFVLVNRNKVTRDGNEGRSIIVWGCR